MMITKTVTMAALERVLCELGYIRHVVPDPHGFTQHALAYTHPSQREVLLMLPMYKANEQVPMLNLVLAQIAVDNAGIADKDTFERLLMESAQHTDLIDAAPTSAA